MLYQVAFKIKGPVRNEIRSRSSSERMYKLYQVFLVSYMCLVAFVLIDVGEANNGQQLHRPKRYLSFRNISHFFVRINWKANMVPWNQIFAQAVGFRVNWDDPPDSFHPYHHIHRRTIYNHLETLLDRNGLNGYHCVRRAICEMEMIAEPREIYHKILKIIFRKKSSATKKWHSSTLEDCSFSFSLCPLSVLEVSRYTDII